MLSLILDPLEKGHSLGFSFQLFRLRLKGRPDPLLDLQLDIFRILTDQDHDNFSLSGVKQIVYDLRSAGIPVQNDRVVRDLQRPHAGLGVLDKIGDRIGYITDDGTCEGDHSDEDGHHTDDDQGYAGLSYILHDILDPARIEDHAHRIVKRCPEPMMLDRSRSERGNNTGSQRKEHHVQDQDRDQDRAGRFFNDKDPDPFFPFFSHRYNLLLL